MWGSGKLSLGLALLRVIAYLQEFYIYQLDDLLLNAEKEPTVPAAASLPPMTIPVPDPIAFAPPPLSVPAPATVYIVPPPTVFPKPSVPVPASAQTTESFPFSTLQPHIDLPYQAPPPMNTTFPKPGMPIHAAPFAPPIHFFPEAETEQERRMKKMEETIKAFQASDLRHSTSYLDSSLFPGMQLTPKIKVPEFHKYDGTKDPRHHLRHYPAKMLSYWDYEQFVVASFHESLLGLALN
ncbi:pollen-specific leucine-rich repeat extensin-like protein 1 [Punica granatum]|uniref:Pollen-specific leucine-rich repeat extensin-like protein 1 n=1 Tax=Punica granatum TaxID=22663 RepID=A0A6P8DIB1_PUNGR|nr:pollen-specific leucine-rich repeat extensin-like protein 1 [Punica granatum]